MNKKYFSKALAASEQRSRLFFSSLSFSFQLMLSDYLSYTISASLTGKIIMSLAPCCHCLQFSINSWQAGNKNFYSLTLDFCQFVELCSNLISALDILLPQNHLLNGSMFPLWWTPPLSKFTWRFHKRWVLLLYQSNFQKWISGLYHSLIWLGHRLNAVMGDKKIKRHP